MRFFSYKNRPVHLGTYPLESLKRADMPPDLSAIPSMVGLEGSYNEVSLAHSISRFLAVMDTVRDGNDVMGPAEIPDDPIARARHLKAMSYYFDASMVGICKLNKQHLLPEPIFNHTIDAIRSELEEGDPISFSTAMEGLYQDVLESTKTKFAPVPHHSHAIVLLTEFIREPRLGEPGTDWIKGIQPERAALLNANTAVVIANYIRMLGFEARAHTVTTSDVDLNRLSVSAGLCTFNLNSNALTNPFVGRRFGLAAVTTTMELDADKPLDSTNTRTGIFEDGLKWSIGTDGVKNIHNYDPYKSREFRAGPYPFEKIKRVEKPTTFLDQKRIPRLPKRTDFFDRAAYGDLGKDVQDASKNMMYVAKSAMGGCAWKALGSLVLFQTGGARGPVSDTLMDPDRNADNVKGASYFLSADATGISSAPEWVYYSHGHKGETIDPYHDNAISLLLDQGHETMEGASGDDWIAVGQSMRAYLRFSMLGNVIAEHIRRLGYSARVHTVIDQDVIQPPLLLLAGLGEVSRIGDVILNPYLGPRLKSGVITTSMPMTPDKPIDFGLQKFCESCNKCARECPSGSITAGPKVMFNGYEIWKSDSEKCTRYRMTNTAGAMCGRCMKTCPWNLEGTFTDSTFRWLAINAPSSAKMLARLDDTLNRGSINPVKKWWWDIELSDDRRRFIKAKSINHRELQKEIKLNYADQSLAAYPADVAPGPYPVIQPVDRSKGIERYRSLLSVEAYQKNLDHGNTETLVPCRDYASEEPPIIPVIIQRRTDLSPDIARFELTGVDGEILPPFEAGAHVDVVVAPAFLRQYSLAGDPADNSKYILGVQRNPEGRGGSILLHETFTEGRQICITPPRNHFPLDENATFSLLMAGGIGVTPMIAMAHRLHALDRSFIFHYSAKSAEQSGFVVELKSVPWADKVFFHFSSDGRRAELTELIPDYKQGYRLYACGGDRYMDAVFDVGTGKNWPSNSLSREYFAVPDVPDYENHPFTLILVKSGKTIEVPDNMTATEALLANNVHIDIKCSNGLCGVCVTGLSSGGVEHRDYVLSDTERKTRIALCCSRAEIPGGEIEIDL